MGPWAIRTILPPTHHGGLSPQVPKDIVHVDPDILANTEPPVELSTFLQPIQSRVEQGEYHSGAFSLVQAIKEQRAVLMSYKYWLQHKVGNRACQQPGVPATGRASNRACQQPGVPATGRGSNRAWQQPGVAATGRGSNRAWQQRGGLPRACRTCSPSAAASWCGSPWTTSTRRPTACGAARATDLQSRSTSWSSTPGRRRRCTRCRPSTWTGASS
jgi:hypothetical protein